VDGAAAPNYHFNRHLLWTSTKTMAITDDPQPPRLSLISEPISTTAGAQTDTRWQYYDAHSTMTPALHTQPMGIVTDVSLIKSDGNLEGEEKAKTEKLTAAVQKHNCISIPFIMHTRGTLGCKAETFIRTLAKSVQPHYQKVFPRTTVLVL
jgi:hypothetical protein